MCTYLGTESGNFVLITMSDLRTCAWYFLVSGLCCPYSSTENSETGIQCTYALFPCHVTLVLRTFQLLVILDQFMHFLVSSSPDTNAN